MRASSAEAAAAKAARLSSTVPATRAGSGTPQCAVIGCPGHTGHSSPAASSPRISRERERTDGAHRGSIIAITKVPRAEAGRYGIVRTRRGEGRVWELADVVEKPTVEEAPSDLGVLGRYVLSPRIFDQLEHTPQGAGGEIQLTDAIRALVAEQPVFGYQFEGLRYDAGTRLGWLEATVSMALDSDLADEFRTFLRGLDLRH